MKLSSILFLTLLLLVAACKPKDEDLTKAIQTSITAVAKDINVNTQDGVVTLSGVVDQSEIIQQIVSLAQGTKGVKSVVNNLTVKVIEPEIVISADDILRTKIQEGFAKYGVQGITATVIDGEVTLTGEIQRTKLIDVMKAVSEALPKKVKNEMVIK